MSRPATDRLKVNPPLGALPVLQYCTPGQLQVDHSYQRSLDVGPSQSLIRKIAMFWDWDLCQPLVVSRRSDGGLYVVDGQHRLEAARLRGDIQQLPCVIATYTAAADEAASFVAFNQQRRPLGALDLFRAALAAGDTAAGDVMTIITEAGLTLAPHSNHSAWKPGMVSNIAGIRAAFRTQGHEDTAAALRILGQAFKAFAALGVAMPNTLASYRQLVEAQDLTTVAGREMFATLIQLAPAFADLKGALEGAASAAAIVRQREDLEKQLLQLQGDTIALRAAELAKIDPSNRALQQQIWAIKDAQEAAKAAEQLRDAWKSVGDTILGEVKRIRGLGDVSSGGGFASLMGQFNAANAAARAGDMDAAKGLPQLSRALLDAAALQATSRQELDRVQTQTAAMLEATHAAIEAISGTAPPSATELLTAAATAQAAAAPAAANDGLVSEIAALRSEVAQMRTDMNAGNAAIAGNTGRTAKALENVTSASGGDAISVSVSAA